MESDKNFLEINMVIWAYEINQANEIALEFLNSQKTIKNKNNFYSLNEKGYKINIYLRSPRTLATSAPQGITNILIIYLTKDSYLKKEISTEFSEAKKYLDTRKKIPFKFLVTETAFPIEIEFDCNKKLLSQFLSQNGKKEIIEEIEIFELTIKNVFEKFDKSKNGLLTSEDIIKASTELGHNLTEDDAKMIVDTLGENNSKSINYEAFKRWWILGRSDFVNFRRICKFRIFLDNFLKSSNIKVNDYIQNLKNEGKQISKEEISQIFDINIHSEKFSENGIGCFLQFCNGKEALDIIETKFEDFENSEFGFGIKLKFISAECAKKELENVEKFVIEILSSILGDRASLIFLLGPIFRFKVSENYIIIYFADKKPKSDTFLTNFDATCSGTLHMFTELTFEDILELPIEGIIRKLANLKLHLNAEIFDFRDIVKKLLKQIDLINKREFEEIQNSPNNKEYIINENEKVQKLNTETFEIQKKYKEIFNLLKYYFLLKSIKLDFSYEASNLKDEFFLLIEELKKQVEKSLGEESFEFKYNRLQQEDDLLLSPANLANLEEKILAYFNLIDFFITELKIYYNEIKKNNDILRNLFEEEIITFFENLDFNEIILEMHSKSIITPLYAKVIFKIPKLNNIIDTILKNN